MREKLRGCTLAGTGSKVPERVLTNADLERMVDTSDEWIVTRTGIRERRISDPGVAVTDLALPAAQDALEMAGVSAADLDIIIVATVTPDRILPSASCTLQERLGASHAAAFDLNAACSGFVYGVSVGSGMIAAGMAETVLVIGAETLSKIVDYEDRGTCVLFGDGAGAAVLRPSDPGHGILATRIRSDGTQGHVLEIPAGGSRMPASHATVDAHGHFIKMKGNELFKFSVRAMETVTRQAVEDAGVSLEQVRFLVPHQANLRIISAVAERLGVGEDRLVLNIDRFGNTSAASIPISLDELLRSGRVMPGDIIGLVAFGGGVTWGAIVLEWDPSLAHPLAVSRAAQGATVTAGNGS
ncbi:MAG TPA: beta-ketoacyl-ACP synthase III [Candidatus Eisenbacteria bacterium]|jgi:3-oxoacyl-[acyl-carrier-protein] synthase-3|nr:beta-ketoacyl-ACP synthase III [Candidatus Eisenbacteria bacterium]